MNFNDATIGLQEGQLWTRTGWNGAGQFVWWVPPGKYPARMEAIKGYFADDLVPYRGYFALKNAQGEVVPWVPSMGDIMALDWTKFSKDIPHPDGNASAVLDLYQSHKQVAAAKIVSILHRTNDILLDLGDKGAISVTYDYFNKHKPFTGGYYVQYEDGYESFSPAEAFESGYDLLKMKAEPAPPAEPEKEQATDPYVQSHRLQHATDVLTQLVGSHEHCGDATLRNALYSLIQKQIEKVKSLQ